MLEGQCRIGLKMNVKKITKGKNTLRMLEEILAMSCFVLSVVSRANDGAKILILSCTEK